MRATTARETRRDERRGKKTNDDIDADEDEDTDEDEDEDTDEDGCEKTLESPFFFTRGLQTLRQAQGAVENAAAIGDEIHPRGDSDGGSRNTEVSR